MHSGSVLRCRPSKNIPQKTTSHRIKPPSAFKGRHYSPSKNLRPGTGRYSMESSKKNLSVFRLILDSLTLIFSTSESVFRNHNTSRLITKSVPSDSSGSDREQEKKHSVSVTSKTHNNLNNNFSTTTTNKMEVSPATNTTLSSLTEKKSTLQKYYKKCNTECKLFGNFWTGQGYKEVPSPDFQKWHVVWWGSHVKKDFFSDLKSYQKVNHFPGTTEVTRKDKLVMNLNRMKEIHADEYNYFPPSWVWPTQSREFLKEHQKRVREMKTGELLWISKPTNLSRGRGITLYSDTVDLIANDKCVVQRLFSHFF